MIARLVEWHEIGTNTRHFVFEVPDVKEFYFIPGQFVSFTETIGEKEIIRPYSIASPPNGNRFEICLNLIEDGLFSPLLFSMNRGDTLEMNQPLGYFVLRNPGKEAIFVATGTGVTPFRSMLKVSLGQGDTKKITLLFGVRHEENLLYRTEFEELAGAHPNFHFEPTVTKPEPAWTGKKGRVQPHLLELIGERRDLDIYICGLKLMVDDVRAILKGLGFDRKQVMFEKYD